eukprot:9067100-Pyramimonas_sp.AAC.1
MCPGNSRETWATQSDVNVWPTTRRTTITGSFRTQEWLLSVGFHCWAIQQARRMGTSLQWIFRRGNQQCLRP